jgi:mRNA export factor
MFGSSAFAGGSAAQNPNKDMAVTQPPNDSISKLAFSPTSNYLIASSWDNNVRSSYKEVPSLSFLACNF